jgi:hypothetical protein
MKREDLSPTATAGALHVEDYNNHDSSDFESRTAKRGGEGVDIAAQLVDDAVAGSISLEQETAVLRRIDLFLMPVMFLSFALQYMDKACLTGAALFGILSDLKLLEV